MTGEVLFVGAVRYTLGRLCTVLLEALLFFSAVELVSSWTWTPSFSPLV